MTVFQSFLDRPVSGISAVSGLGLGLCCLSIIGTIGCLPLLSPFLFDDRVSKILGGAGSEEFSWIPILAQCQILISLLVSTAFGITCIRVLQRGNGSLQRFAWWMRGFSALFLLFVVISIALQLYGGHAGFISLILTTGFALLVTRFFVRIERYFESAALHADRQSGSRRLPSHRQIN
jgi:hypothetical protein